MNQPIQVTTESFEREVLRSSLPALVDFYATWCGPCKMIAPVLNRLAEELAGQVKIVKVDVEESASLARRYGITGVPTLMLFRGEVIQDAVVGLISPQALKARLQASVEDAKALAAPTV